MRKGIMILALVGGLLTVSHAADASGFCPDPSGLNGTVKVDIEVPANPDCPIHQGGNGE